MQLKSNIKKYGNSKGFTIPAVITKELNISIGDIVTVTTNKKNKTITLKF